MLLTDSQAIRDVLLFPTMKSIDKQEMQGKSRVSELGCTKIYSWSRGFDQDLTNFWHSQKKISTGQYRLLSLKKLKIVLLRGHFLKKFRRCPLFALQEQLKYRKENSMEHTKTYQEFKKNGKYKVCKIQRRSRNVSYERIKVYANG